MAGFTKERTTSGQVTTGLATVQGATLTAGADAASAALYDNTAGSGNPIVTLKASANTTVNASFPEGIRIDIGVYATLTGTSPSVFVHYA